MDIIITVIIAIYGLLAGSFLNAWIWRLKTGRKVSRGRSMCPHCKTQLTWYELIPLISYVGLRRRCRTCHKRISWQYPAVELANALLWVGLFWLLPPNDPWSIIHLVIWLGVASLMLAAFVYDARWMLLPDHFTVPAIVLAAIWLLIQASVLGQVQATLWELLGAVVFSGAFYSLWALSGGKWLGDGDIRLALLMGLLLTPLQLMLAIFFSFNLGAIVGLILIALKLKKRQDSLAFGPFLIIGLFLGLSLGEPLLNLYLRLLS